MFNCVGFCLFFVLVFKEREKCNSHGGKRNFSLSRSHSGAKMDLISFRIEHCVRSQASFVRRATTEVQFRWILCKLIYNLQKQHWLKKVFLGRQKCHD